MKKIFYLVVFILTVLIGIKLFYKNSYQDKIAQMIMVGFDGLTLTPENPIYRDIRKNHIGGVILFNQKGWDKNTQRNIKDPDQLKNLIKQLQQISNIPLFIAIDQEGGKVARLSPEFGVSTYTAGELGQMNDLTITQREADKTSSVLKNLGINVNFAPCVDITLNSNSIIKFKDRAFSDNDAQIVVMHAEQFIKAYQKVGVLPVLKHFPGHGSATGDTHEGYVDITNEYQSVELEPYQILLPKYPEIGVMVAHVFNRHVDTENPLSLSYQNVTKNLKEDLHFKGIIFSDDLQMGALTKRHSWHDIVVKAINAGNDVLVIGNNLTYDPDIADKTLKIILKALKDGEIKPERIDEAYDKIMKTKSKFLKDYHVDRKN